MEKEIRQLLDESGLAFGEEDFQSRVRVVEYEAAQYLIELGDEAAGPRLFCGNRMINLSEIDLGSVRKLEWLLGDYLARNVQPDGRMTYLYYPSRGEEDFERNNSIRQWMASLALCRTARFRCDLVLEQVAARNVNYNLKTMFRDDGGFGLIEEGDKVKLGAVALAFLTLHEMSRDVSNHRFILESLSRTITFLWNDTGEFRTFFRPSYCGGQQNFYPGEALLAWATVCSTGDSTLMTRCLRSFEFYRVWHRRQRNPAFVPWHTQAYFRFIGSFGGW